MQKSLRLAIVGLALLVAAPAAAAAPQTILVKFEQPARGAAVVEALGDDAVGRTATRVEIVRVGPGESVAARVAAYERRAEVVYAEPNHEVHALTINAPNDPQFSSEWAFATADALGGWTLYPGAYGDAGGALLAVVDTGVQASHPDLVGQVRTDLGAICLNLAPCVPG